MFDAFDTKTLARNNAARIALVMRALQRCVAFLFLFNCEKMLRKKNGRLAKSNGRSKETREEEEEKKTK